MNLKILTWKFYLIPIVCISIVGCSTGKDSVLFVTKTTLGVDVDSKPPTIDIGFRRTEGTVAPVLPKGEVLSQMAAFSTDDGMISQAVGQSFATGEAAEIMSKYLGKINSVNTTGDIPEPVGYSEKDDVPGGEDKRKRYFFGTDTGFGFKVGLGAETGGIPDSVNLGYRRKEIAYVPLITKDNKIGLASLIATAGLSTDATSGELQHTQFFATGKAASYLAANPYVRNTVGPKILPDSKMIADHAIKALENVNNIHEIQAEVRSRFGKLSAKYNLIKADQSKKSEFDQGAVLAGYNNFVDMSTKKNNITSRQLDAIETYLKSKNLI